MKTHAYIFLADGFEEIEAVCPADILRRSTPEVQLVSVTDGLTVTSAHGVRIVADMDFPAFLEHWKEVSATVPPHKCLLVFPGGLPGATNLAACGPLVTLAARHFSRGGLVGAICAAPGTLLPVMDAELRAEGHPGIRGRRFTCYPGCEGEPVALGAVHTGVHCETDGNLVTANGPGSAMDFAYALAQQLMGSGAVETLRRGMMWRF